MTNLPTLNIVNSCYNPAIGWEEEYLRQAAIYYDLFKDDYNVQFVLVNDGSTSSLDEAIKFISEQLSPFKYVSYQKNRGKGYALRYGIKQCEGHLYCYTDVDFPYTAASLNLMLETMHNCSADLVMGERNADYFKSIPIQRRLISKSLIWVNKWLLRLDHPDTQCGIKLINQKGKEAFLKIRTEGFLFEVDFILQNRKLLKIVKAPVQLRSSTVLNNIKISTLVRLLKEYIGIRNHKSE